MKDETKNMVKEYTVLKQKLFEETHYRRLAYTTARDLYGVYDHKTGVAFERFRALYTLIEETPFLEDEYNAWVKEQDDAE